jgi:D-3-phosphoglycerate dehydrogenase / 2-oxoglutarate reductase
MHRGVWQKTAKSSYEVRGKTLGVVGYGNIGAQLGVLAEGIGMQVIFFDVVKKLNLGNARQVDEPRRAAGLGRRGDPARAGDAGTRNLIDAAALAKMKPESVLINASRGDVVDLDALAGRLRAGALLGAAIDVFPKEPKSNDEPFESPLVGPTCC